MAKIFEKINATNKDIIQNLIRDWNVQQTFKLTYNEALLKLEADTARRELELRILELKEQEKIARKIQQGRDPKSRNDANFALNQQMQLGNGLATSSKDFTYLHEPEAIEAMTSVLEDRRSNEFLDNQIRMSRAFKQFEMLKASDKSQTLKEIMSRLDFIKPSFKPIDIETRNIKFKDAISSTMVLVFAAMVGALAGILVALLANIRQRFKP